MGTKKDTTKKTESENVYRYPRPEVAVDVVMFGYLPSDRSLRVLLYYRKDEKKWAFPGHIVRCSPTRDNDDKKYPGEYGPEAETIPQAFREALQIEAKPFSRTFDESENKVKKVKKMSMSQHYVSRDEKNDFPKDPVDFQKDECLAQLPVRSEIRRDKDRMKDGKPVNKRVISIPILTMASRGLVWDDVNRYTDSAWVPLDWLVEDNIKNTNSKSPDSDLRSLFKGNDGPYIRSTKQRNSDHYALCFDHVAVLRSGIYAMRQCARCRPIAREMLDKRFRMSDLARIYEYIFDKEIDVANLRRVFIKEKDSPDNLLLVTNIKEEAGSGRKPSTLVEFNDIQYDGLVESLNFRFPLFG